MSGTEQTWNWVGGTNYGTGDYGLGSAQKYAAGDNPYYDPGLSIDAASFEAGVLRANLNAAWNGDLGSGKNSQMGNVDMTFGMQTTNAALQPPIITRTEIDGSIMTGQGGEPAGGFVPNPTSPTQPNEYAGVTTPSSIPVAPSGYAENLPSSGKGSTVSPGEVAIAAAGNTLVGTGLVKGYRPGRTGVDEAHGGS